MDVYQNQPWSKNQSRNQYQSVERQPVEPYESYFGISRKPVQSRSHYQSVKPQPEEHYEPHLGIPRKPVQSLNSLDSFRVENDDIMLIDRSNNTQIPLSIPRPHSNSVFQWWLPEILATFFSLASMISLIIVLRHCNGRSLDDLRLPSWLTLNGLIALIATMNRVALVAPVEAALSQEIWLWLASPNQRAAGRSRLEDLEISDAASRGAWGSFVLLWKGKGR